MPRTLPLLLAMTLVQSLFAAPRLDSILPLSCQVGRETEVRLAGKELGEATALVFSVPGISAERKDKGTFVVRVAKDARPQACDVWCVAGGALSNPRRFVLTRYSSVAEDSANSTPHTAQAVSVPGAVDGRLATAAEIDWYRFTGKRGDEVTLICRSRTLDGSVEPDVAVIGPKGRELARADGRRREPVLTLTIPAEGGYLVRIADRAYRKNDQSFYRLDVLTGKRVMGCFPDVLTPDSEVDVALFGFGLQGPLEGRIAGSRAPLTRMTWNASIDALNFSSAWQPAVSPWRQVALPLPEDVAGLAVVSIADSPVVIENETGTALPDVSQRLELPILLNGRFDRRGDVDWYSFAAKKGDALRVELYGDRLGRQMDLDATILNDAGKSLVTFPDAGKPKGVPAVLASDSLDVSAVWKAPADGEYRLAVRDLLAGSHAGVDHTYALSLRAVTPAFRVYAVPGDGAPSTGPVVPQAGHGAWQLFAERQDSFDGPIRISVDESESPEGVSLDECWIGPGATTTTAVLSAAAEADGSPRFVKLTAEGQIGEQTVTLPVFVTTPLTNSSAAGRLIGRPVMLVEPKQPLGFTIENRTPTVAAGGKLQLVVLRSHLEGTLKSATLAFPVLPPGMKDPNAKLADEMTNVELPIPEKLPKGRYSIAATVSATVMPVAEGDAKPKERSLRVWTNSVVFEVK